MYSNVSECVVNENWLNTISIGPGFPNRVTFYFSLVKKQQFVTICVL